MAPRPVKIDIISDIVCPFCLLGQKQVQGAITKFNGAHPSTGIEPSIRFLPYQLSPDNKFSPEPKDKVKMYEEKFGPRAKELRAQMADRFVAHGLKLHPTGEVSSSHRGHRLQALALDKKPEIQPDLAGDLFIAYHTDGIHPSDLDTLSKYALKYELFSSEQEAKEWLEKGKEYDEEVKKGYASARAMGISGVPFFIFDNKYAISGAVGEESFVEFFEKTYGDASKGEAGKAAGNGEAVC